MGFSVALFQLEIEKRNWQVINQLISSNEQLGLKHIWADQVEAVLNAVPGPKIIFAFSNPSASAIEAIARRHAVDICGLICDSGPTSEIFRSMLSYFSNSLLIYKIIQFTMT